MRDNFLNFGGDFNMGFDIEFQNAQIIEKQETDPTISEWAKQPEKPIYHYSEILDTPPPLEPYELPIASQINLGGVKTSDEINVDSNGALTVGSIPFSKISGLSNMGANVIEAIRLGSPNGTLCTITPETADAVIPIASNSTFGLVKGASSDVNDGIIIGSDGLMEINSINVSKLYISDGDELILDGGAAQVKAN